MRRDAALTVPTCLNLIYANDLLVIRNSRINGIIYQRMSFYRVFVMGGEGLMRINSHTG